MGTIVYADDNENKPALLPARKLPDGTLKVGELGQHHDDLSVNGDKVPENERGFVDRSGKFLGREEAATVAKSAGLDVPDSLHSEHLNQALGLEERKPSGKIVYEEGPASERLSEDAKPMGFWERLGTGIKDVGVAAEQIMARRQDMPGGSALMTPEAAANNELEKQKLEIQRDDRIKKTDEAVSNREASIQASEKASGRDGIDWARLGGNILGTAPLAALSPAAAGAASGALTPVVDGDFATEKFKQIALGSVAGKLGEIGGNTLAKIVEPTKNAAKEALLKAGVELTAGQSLGNLGASVEKVLKSLPFTSKVVHEAEQKSLDSFNVATAEKALSPILEPMKAKLTATTGRQAIEEGQKVLDQAYDHVLDRMGTFRADTKFVDAMNELESMASEMPPGLGDQFTTIVRNRIGKRLEGTPGGASNGTMDGRTFKQVESELRVLAQSKKASQDEGQRQIGHALDAARDALRENLARQDPKVADALRKVNKAYAQFAPVERAASSSAKSEARFTPSQLLQAIKTETKSPRKRMFAAGKGGELQKWAEDAYKVFGDVSSSPENPWEHISATKLGLGVAATPARLAYSDPGMDLLKKFAIAAPKTRNLLANISRQGGQLSGQAAGVGANVLNAPGN